jgi:hypothetical protein
LLKLCETNKSLVHGLRLSSVKYLEESKNIVAETKMQFLNLVKRLEFVLKITL